MGAVATRAARTEQVRQDVLDAARREFLAAGYHGTSLDRIAAAAGYTKGAVYSRFTSKADLFLALLEERIEVRAARNEAAGEQSVRELVRRWSAEQHDDLPWTLLVVEFRIHCARDPELNARYDELHQRAVDGIAAGLTRVLGRGGASVRRLAQRIHALSNGGALEQAVDPGAFPTDVVARVIGAVVDAEVGGRR